jgi:hypothetical protein
MGFLFWQLTPCVFLLTELGRAGKGIKEVKETNNVPWAH